MRKTVETAPVVNVAVITVAVAVFLIIAFIYS